jgi:WS/DGAT/MGAT family acyltransferase
MTDSEAIMWAVEKDPALRSDFCNLTILDRRPTDVRLRATMQRALEGIPRLRQRVVAAPLRLVPPDFADDPTLDLDAHMGVVAVPSPGDERTLLDLCGRLAEQPLDRARPLWEFTMIEGLPEDRVALLQKVHHTITDGVGGLRLSLALVDFERDPDTKDADIVATTPPGITPMSNTRDALLDATHRSLGALAHTAGAAGRAVAHPAELPGRAAQAIRMVSSLQRQALVTGCARSDVMTARSLRRHLEVHRLNLAALRIAADRYGGSVNDAFVTGLAGALGRYHERAGSDVDELRVAMPVSTREHGDQSTNRFVPARVVVPIQPWREVGELFAGVHERLHAAKRESALGAAEGLAGLVSGLPTSLLVAMTRSQTRTIDFAASNLRGSPVPLYLAGARIIANYPFGPRTGSALNVTMLTYCDEAHMGLNIDPAAIDDAGAFIDDVAESYAALGA